MDNVLFTIHFTWPIVIFVGLGILWGVWHVVEAEIKKRSAERMMFQARTLLELIRTMGDEVEVNLDTTLDEKRRIK